MTGPVVVTGASSGIGRACVERLAKAGVRTFPTVRKDADALALTQAFANSSASASLRTVGKVRTPALASRSTHARPMPLEAPVTTTGPVTLVLLCRNRADMGIGVGLSTRTRREGFSGSPDLEPDRAQR